MLEFLSASLEPTTGQLITTLRPLISNLWLVSDLLTFSYHVWGSHNQEWKSGGMQDTLSDTAYHPLLQPAKSMRCHRNYLRTAKDSCSPVILTLFCYSDNPSCDIGIDGHRRGNQGLEVCYRAGE